MPCMRAGVQEGLGWGLILPAQGCPTAWWTRCPLEQGRASSSQCDLAGSWEDMEGWLWSLSCPVASLLPPPTSLWFRFGWRFGVGLVWAASVPLIIPRVLAWGWLEKRPCSNVPIRRCGQSVPPHPLALPGALLCPT